MPNCSGVKLDEQEKVYAGRVTGGTPFYRHADLQQLGIPVLVGIYGTNPAGGGYHSISPTVLIAHEKANMAVGGAGIVGGMNPKGYVDAESAQALIDATAAAHYVMDGPQGNDTNVFSLGTAATEIYVMHGETAAAAIHAGAGVHYSNPMVRSARRLGSAPSVTAGNPMERNSLYKE